MFGLRSASREERRQLQRRDRETKQRIRVPGHVPTPPRPQTGFAAAGLPQGRPQLFENAYKKKIDCTQCAIRGILRLVAQRLTHKSTHKFFGCWASTSATGRARAAVGPTPPTSSGTLRPRRRRSADGMFALPPIADIGFRHACYLRRTNSGSERPVCRFQGNVTCKNG